MTALYPVVILAGGLATRLRPMTETIPKSLLEINGEPFITHQLRLLQRQGVREVVLCVGYLGEMIEAYIGNGSAFGLNVQYSYDGPLLRGTGGAIQQALPLLPETFFVLYGDSYLDCNYGDVQKTFQSTDKLGLMTVFQNEGQWDTSNIEYADKKIIAYDKVNRTERMRYIDYGLGILTKQALFQRSTALNLPDTLRVSTLFYKEGDETPPLQKGADTHSVSGDFKASNLANKPENDAAFDLASLYQTLLQNHQLAACEITNRFYEVGSHSGIQELACLLNQGG